MESKIVKAKARSPKDKQQEWGSWGRENELYLESNALLPTTSGAVLRPSEGFFPHYRYSRWLSTFLQRCWCPIMSLANSYTLSSLSWV